MDLKLLIQFRKSHRIIPQNNSETIANEHDKKYLKKYISPEEREKIIDDLRLI